MTYDKDFLLKLDKSKNKTIYARITALQFDESPIEFIEGRVTQGSINVDGASAVRRSCSLTIVANNFDYRNYYWGLNTKFKLEIGVENNVDTSHYPAICWFEQGVFLITNFNTSKSTNNFSISISGKDKMCQLNGELSGNFESSIDFGQIEEQNLDGSWKIIKLPIFRIIREMIHQYAGEPYHNIIINDLEDYGLELLDYQYDTPMYLYRSIDSNIFTNVLFDGTKECIIKDGENEISTTLEKVDPKYLDLLVDTLMGTSDPTPIVIEGNEYYVAKVEYGQTAGYRMTDLVYPGDLVAAAGDTITSVLDKLVNMLGEFEYFYNLDGQFVFQRKQAFVNTLWSPIVENEDEQYVESLAIASSHSYVFNDGELITAFNNTPNLTNLKNDYSIWGSRTSIKGTDIPIHMRYAIDKKPTYYKNMAGQIFVTDMEVYEKEKESVKQDAIKIFYNRLYDYELTYKTPRELGAPKKQEDGSWSPGWWDIRDWYNYYQTLTLTIPSYTMKWYSSNDLDGCVSATSLNIPYTYNLSEDNYVWLLIRRPDGTYNPQHGNGNPDRSSTPCTLYSSEYIDEEAGTYVTKPVIGEDGNPIRKEFIQPYAGCSNSHTYISFLEGDIKDQGNTVYFYNPKFPEAASFEELVHEQIDKEYQDYLESGVLNFVDWREIIYQMALDYYQYNQDEDFEERIKENNANYYPTGMTGYESYYIDLEGFWRQLYHPIWIDVEQTQKKLDKAVSDQEFLQVFIANFGKSKEEQKTYITSQYNELMKYDANLFQKFFTSKSQFGVENTPEENKQQVTDDLLMSFSDVIIVEKTSVDSLIIKYETKLENLKGITGYYSKEDEHPYWHEDVYISPQSLNFWFDFLDSDGELSQFSVKNVGRRSKVVNDTAVKSIYFRETPDIIFAETGVDEVMTGYKYIQIPNVDTMFQISTQGKSAKDRLDELIYNHAYCVENATITSIPIYYLEPNTRVYLHDTDTNLCGDYIVSKFSIPLSYNGTMSITATKAAENIV